MPSQGFRAGVGVVIAGDDGRVLVFERQHQPGAHQFPQGGLDLDEEPATGALRELHEETGLTADDVELVAEHPEWLTYELPEQHRRGRWRGQSQRWYLFRLTSSTERIDLSGHGEAPEFRGWSWMTFDEIVEGTIEFRRGVYRRLQEEFEMQVAPSR
ncbi:MAG: RNA pyrophosphohydrolase [Acidobacteriota bacterium]